MKLHITVLILIGLFLGGCATAVGRGMHAGPENWYKQGVSKEQTAADLKECQQRAGYGDAIIFTEKAYYSYSSFMDGCMDRKGYQWYRGRHNPRVTGAASEEQVSSQRKEDVNPVQPAPAPRRAVKVEEYWSWGLGVIVRTDKTTTITQIADHGHSSARTDLKLGDEIVKVGTVNIDASNAYKILTKAMPTETDGLVTLLIVRNGKNLERRVKPNRIE